MHNDIATPGVVRIPRDHHLTVATGATVDGAGGEIRSERRASPQFADLGGAASMSVGIETRRVAPIPSAMVAGIRSSINEPMGARLTSSPTGHTSWSPYRRRHFGLTYLQRPIVST